MTRKSTQMKFSKKIGHASVKKMPKPRKAVEEAPPLVETLKFWTTYTVKVTTEQYVQVTLPEGAGRAAVKERANEIALYEGECYDVEIMSDRPATNGEIHDAEQS